MDKNIVLAYIKEHPGASSKQIADALANEASLATIKRAINELVSSFYINVEGKARATKYFISPLFAPINLDEYYSKEIDEREVQTGYNFDLIPNVLNRVSLFTEQEMKMLSALQAQFTKNFASLSDEQKHKEMERLGIDLSWKSSQIEGNTYSLLETERLLKEKQTAAGKTKEEAIMLLNHKEALDFIVANPDYLEHLTISRIEDIHSLLIKDLGVDHRHAIWSTVVKTYLKKRYMCSSYSPIYRLSMTETNELRVSPAMLSSLPITIVPSLSAQLIASTTRKLCSSSMNKTTFQPSNKYS